MFFHFLSFCYTRAFQGKLFNVNYLRCNIASVLQFLHSFVIIAYNIYSICFSGSCIHWFQQNDW